jgi:hypothetical protein
MRLGPSVRVSRSARLTETRTALAPTRSATESSFTKEQIA